MKKSLRRFLHRRITLAVLLCGLLSGVGAWIVAELSFRGVIASTQEEGMRDSERRLALMDSIMQRIERDANESGARALKALGGMYENVNDALASNEETLRIRARRLGVSHIYIIDAKGKVRLTTFAPDRGLDMHSIGTQFSAFLRDIYGRGEIVNQGLSQASQTGEINIYQYYSPSGSNLIIEVSISIDEAISRTFPGKTYADFIDMIFAPATEPSSSFLFTRVIDIVSWSNFGLWSLYSGDRASPEIIDLYKRATQDVPASIGIMVDGKRIRAMKLDDAAYWAEERGQGYYAILSTDMRMIERVRSTALLTCVIVCLLSVLGAYLTTSSVLDKHIALRIESLERSLARAAQGSFDVLWSDQGGDEISSMGSKLLTLVSGIRERAAHMESLNVRLKQEIETRSQREEQLSFSLAEKDELLREVHHRVKNNLQIVESMLSLQIESTDDPKAAAALRSAWTKILSLALVHDQLYAKSSLSNVDMASFLRELGEELVRTEKRPHESGCGGLALTVEAEGMRLGTGRAIPLGIAAAELLAAFLRSLPDSAENADVDMRLEDREGTIMLTIVLCKEVSGLPACEGWDKGGALVIARALAEQLGGKLVDLCPEAIGYRLELPDYGLARELV